MKKNLLHITATIDQPDLLENMVEKLADRRMDQGFENLNLLGDWQLVDTSSIEKYVSGAMQFSVGREKFDIPFITSFLFSCTKERNDPYRLNWSISLS